jgi:transcriptional regulator, araC family
MNILDANQIKDFESLIEKPAELVWIGNNIKNHNIKIDFHNHGNLGEIVYTGNCSGYIYDEDGETSFPPHSVILRGKYTNHRESYRLEGKQTNIFYCNFRNLKLVNHDELTFPTKAKSTVISLNKNENHNVYKFLKAIYSESEEKRFAHKKYSDYLLNILLIILFRNIMNSNGIDNFISNDVGLPYKIKKYIDDNYNKPDFSLSKIAESLYISKSYVTKIFKNTFAYNPMDYVNQKRIALAITYLLNTDETLNEIAYKLGYSNSLQFIRLFKRHIGKTPSEFRKTTDLYHQQ